MDQKTRRSDRALDEAAAWSILKSADWGMLALADESGAPYAVPLNHVCNQHSIYFHCAQEGKKLDLIRRNTAACFTVVTQAEVLPEAFSTRYESAMAFGKVFLIDDEDQRIQALTALCARHAPGSEQKAQAYILKAQANTAVLRLDVVRVSAKARR